MKSIEHGIRTPKSDFEKRANDVNTVGKVARVGKKGGSGSGSYATQTKKVGKGDRQQS